jgi:hypothetical protein
MSRISADPFYCTSVEGFADYFTTEPLFCSWTLARAGSASETLNADSRSWTRDAPLLFPSTESIASECRSLVR